MTAPTEQADAVTETYPAHREATVVLRDGSTLTIRPVRAGDAAELGRFFSDLSLESRVFRFFAAVANADSSISRMVNVNYTSSYGLVAVAGAKAGIVGHAMYVETAPRKAEMALAVADAYQGRGLGTILLGQLAEVAAVTHLLAPASVAVIGASRQAGSIGAAVVHNLVAYGFHGPIYPVNP